MKKNHSPHLLNAAGFTLMEIMISILLLAFISMGIYTATTGSYALREKIVAAANFNTEVRLSMGVLERDINLLFSPISMMPARRPGAQGGGQAVNQHTLDALGRATPWWGAAMDPSGLRPSRFVGTDSKITMITASNIRLYKESPESIFAKVSYELVDDPTADRSEPRKMLLKVMTPNAFDEDDSRDIYIKKYPLLHGIKKWEFKYYRADKASWTTSWDNESGDLKNLYPDIIQVKLEVTGASRSFFEGLYKFKTEIPPSALSSTL